MKSSTIIITNSSRNIGSFSLSIKHNVLYALLLILSAMVIYSSYIFTNQNNTLQQKQFQAALSENQMLLVKTSLLDNHIDGITGRLLGQNKDIDRLNTMTTISDEGQDMLLNDNYLQVFLEREVIGSRLTKYKIKIGNREVFEYFVDNQYKEDALVTEQKIYDVKNNLQQIINSSDFKKEINVCQVGEEEYIGLIDNVMVFFATKHDAQKNNMETAQLAGKYQKLLKRELKIARDNCFLQGNPTIKKIAQARKKTNINDLTKNIERKEQFVSSILKDDSIRIANVYGKTVQIQANFARTPSIYPLQYNFITSPYGFRVHPITGRYILHTGMDFAALIGTRIKSTADGIVTYAGWMYGYGNTIIVNNGFGMSTLYAHCSQINVRRGQRIKKNITIGLTGNSGLVAGPHLHYEIRKSAMSIDPAPYLSRDILTAKKDW